MTARLCPIDVVPVGLFPGDLLPGGDASACLIYVGVGCPTDIDYAAPAAEVRGGQTSASLTATSLDPWTRYWFAVRERSAYGVEAHTTRLLTCVEVDEQGQHACRQGQPGPGQHRPRVAGTP